MKKHAMWMAVALVVFASLWRWSPDALAGGGPQNVLLVVNADSAISKEVAAAYQSLRGIPDSNIVFVHPPAKTTITDAEFKAAIYQPVLDFIAAGGLAEQIDYIVYSAGFDCYSVNKTSLTSATMFGESNPEPEFPAENPPAEKVLWRLCNYFDSGRAFSHAESYAPQGGGEPERYYLSFMLGYSGPRGNTAEEIVACLKQGVLSDFTFPKGAEVWLINQEDPRARARVVFHENTVKNLPPEPEFAFRVLKGLPPKAEKIMLLFEGLADPGVHAVNLPFLPGAYADHLTSFGAHFEVQDQMKISEWIRAGATFTSGAVAEPLSAHQKFARPELAAMYGRGFNAAESLAMSVSHPWQLLMVGEPLAQPYARPPKMTVQGPADWNALQGAVEIKIAGDTARPEGIQRVDCFLDGKWLQTVHEAPAGETHVDLKMQLDTAALSDGWHELRWVAYDASPARTQGHLTQVVVVANQGQSLACTPPAKATPTDKDIVIEFTAAKLQPKAVEVRRLGQVLAGATGASGKLKIPASALGRGEHVLTIVAVTESGAAVAASPVTVTVIEPELKLPFTEEFKKDLSNWDAGADWVIAEEKLAPKCGASNTTPTAVLRGTRTLKDCALELTFYGVEAGVDSVSLWVRSSGPRNGYRLRWAAKDGLYLEIVVNGKATVLDSLKEPGFISKDVKLGIDVSGNRLTASRDGKVFLRGTDKDKTFASGAVMLEKRGWKQVTFDTITVKK